VDAGCDVLMRHRCRRRSGCARKHPYWSQGLSPSVATLPRGCGSLRCMHVHLVLARRSL